MYKKIFIGILLILVGSAFPIRLLELPLKLEFVGKILKGIIFISLLFFLLSKYGLAKKIKHFNAIPIKVILKLIPVFILVGLFVILQGGKISSSFGLNDTTTIVLAIISTFVLAYSEEILCRGYIFNILNLKFTVLKSVLISSALFALLHLVNFRIHIDVFSLVNQIIFAMGLGMLFGSIYALTKNLLMVAVLHFLINIPGEFSELDFSKVNEIKVDTLAENLMSTLFFIITAIPLYMLSLYYVKNVREKKTEVTETSD